MKGDYRFELDYLTNAVVLADVTYTLYGELIADLCNKFQFYSSRLIVVG